MGSQRDSKALVNDIVERVSGVVFGREEIKRLLLVALLARGHVLIEGLPGTAKTTLARTFARVIGGRFRRIQGTPDLLPADMLGFYLYRQDGTRSFMPGPVFANVLLVDELNRLTPRAQSALLEAMQERQVTIEGETHPLEEPFVVIAAQLPRGAGGTSPLTDVQSDRFMFRAWSGFPEPEEEDAILRNIDRLMAPQVAPVVGTEDVARMQQDVQQVHVADSVRAYIIDLCHRLRRQTDLSLGPGPRAGIALLRGARALAFVQGRDFVTPDDVKALAVPALVHRLHVSPEAEMENVTPESVVAQVLAEVPVPTGA